MRYCPISKNLKAVGRAEPDTELHIALEAYRSDWQHCFGNFEPKCRKLLMLSVFLRSQLFVRPVGCLEGQYGPSSSCVAWKEHVHSSSEVRSILQCPASQAGLLPLMVNTLAVPDSLQHIASHGEEDWDPAYVIHLHPVATLRNYLPYTVRYMMEVRRLPSDRLDVTQKKIKAQICVSSFRAQQTRTSSKKAARQTS